MILDYVEHKEDIMKAYHERNSSNEDEDRWLDLLANDDDLWQKLINYIYHEEDN